MWGEEQAGGIAMRKLECVGDVPRRVWEEQHEGGQGPLEPEQVSSRVWAWISVLGKSGRVGA